MLPGRLLQIRLATRRGDSSGCGDASSRGDSSRRPAVRWSRFGFKGLSSSARVLSTAAVLSSAVSTATVSIVAVSTVAVSTLAVGCASEQQRPRTAAEYNEQARRAYEDAMREYQDSSWEFATQKFTELRRSYPNTPWALKAQMRLADILFEQGRYPEAVSLYQTYVSEHPTDSAVEYARFRVIESQFESVSNTIFQPPLEERDLATIHEAHTNIRSFRVDYPRYNRNADLRYMLEAVSGLLVRHELYVARFYLARDEFEAAKNRVQYALRTYEATGLEAEAVVLLGEVYLKQKQGAKAEALFRHVIERFPDSPFTVPARRFLAIVEASPAPASPTPASPAPARAL